MHGLEDKRDYSVVEVGFPNMRAMLAEKKADLISAVLPFSINPELLKIARPLFTVKDAIGRSEFIVWAARERLPAEEQGGDDRFHGGLGTCAPLPDGSEKSRCSCWKIAARVSKLPASAFSGWMYTKKDLYRDPDMIPDIDAFQRSIDVQQDLGLLEGQDGRQELLRFELREGRSEARQIDSGARLFCTPATGSCPIAYELYARQAIGLRMPASYQST